MKENEYLEDSRAEDQLDDHKREEDRRQLYDFVYWESGGIERRSGKERRQQSKKSRPSRFNVSEWSSVCKRDKDDQ
ncbi:MAG: hypothetical protein PVH85_33155 [Desulfobacterales bacterium]|jgi:hypothetical protein